MTNTSDNCTTFLKAALHFTSSILPLDSAGILWRYMSLCNDRRVKYRNALLCQVTVNVAADHLIICSHRLFTSFSTHQRARGSLTKFGDTPQSSLRSFQWNLHISIVEYQGTNSVKRMNLGSKQNDSQPLSEVFWIIPSSPGFRIRRLEQWPSLRVLKTAMCSPS